MPIAISITAAFSSTTDSFALSNTGNLTQAGVGALFQTQSIGTTAEALDLGDLANVGGLLVVKNTDATNYVEVDAVNTFNSFPQKILPGQAIVLGAQTTTIYARANTAAVSVVVAAAAS